MIFWPLICPLPLYLADPAFHSIFGLEARLAFLCLSPKQGLAVSEFFLTLLIHSLSPSFPLLAPLPWQHSLSDLAFRLPEEAKSMDRVLFMSQSDQSTQLLSTSPFLFLPWGYLYSEERFSNLNACQQISSDFSGQSWEECLGPYCTTTNKS